MNAPTPDGARDPADDQTAPAPSPADLIWQNAGRLFGQLLREEESGPADMTEPLSRGQPWQPPTVETMQGLLPEYEILQFVARGGMGAVYKAIQRNLQRLVAIKILPPEVMEDEGLRHAERFKQEARAMAKLNHPCIVTVHTAGEAGRFLYIVMEFVDGTDVAQMVKQNGPLPSDLVLKICASVCDALAYAHSLGVIHRDIKPSNIMVDKAGTVKVADFGLAKLTAHDAAGLTQTNLAMGTPDFAAPETFIPGSLVDQRADIYAVGVMLYQMLTGKIPRGHFESASSQAPKINKRFDAIIQRAMQTDREKRYSSAAALRDDLARVPMPSPDGQGRRKTKHLLLAAAALAILAAGALAFLPPLRTGMRAKAPSPVKAPRATLTNSLGMKFVPVPGTDVLFCIHETRRQDYAAFAATVPGLNGDWNRNRGPFEDDHPVCFMNFKEAQQFCTWLSSKEGKTYRLPTDHEWSLAVGLDETAPLTHEVLEAGPLDTTHYPWNGRFPPEVRDGNYAGMEWLEMEARHHPKAQLSHCNDGFLVTSPVMTFKANPFGLYDMGGNLEEFCVFNPDGEGRRTEVLRGAWFYTPTTPEDLLSSRRTWPTAPSTHGGSHGFRVVLEMDASVTVPVSPSPSNL